MDFVSKFRHGPAVKKLLGWKQGDEDDKWADKAIEVLVGKLKKHKGALQDLEFALNNPSPNTKCVPIPRSRDGRLQVACRKHQPHVIYCRVWRWPDLQSHHELKALHVCRFPYETKEQTGQVCINPYHYVRVDAPNVFPPILVPRYSEFPPPIPPPRPQIGILDALSPGGDFDMSNEPMPSNMEPSSSNYVPTSPAVPDLLSSPSDQNLDNQTTTTMSSCKHDSSISNDQEMSEVHYNEPELWCSVAYYELNNRVGDLFRVKSDCLTFVIDGFTSPSQADRFCLGSLSGINRNPTIEKTRHNIGPGVRISIRDGEVVAENQSNASIFIQSRNYNYLAQYHPSTVCKVPSGCSLKIFNYNEFSNLLNQMVRRGFSAVYDLIKMCIVRMSFVKGWGAEYHRQDVTSTPCWVEIHLHGAMQWLDKVIMEMSPSPNEINSQ